MKFGEQIKYFLYQAYLLNEVHHVDTPIIVSIYIETLDEDNITWPSFETKQASCPHKIHLCSHGKVDLE